MKKEHDDELEGMTKQERIIYVLIIVSVGCAMLLFIAMIFLIFVLYKYYTNAV